MLSVSQAVDQSPFTLGKFYGNSRSTIADKSLDWTPLRALSAHSSGSSEGYPSPPMSGSPSSSAAAPRENSTAPEYLPIPSIPSQDHRHPLSKETRNVSQETNLPPMTGSMLHPSSSSNLHGQFGYLKKVNAAQELQRSREHDYRQIQSTGSSSNFPTSAFPTEAGASGSDAHEHPSSPKSQRKAKGHVASACKPCKRAHLRSVLSIRSKGEICSCIDFATLDAMVCSVAMNFAHFSP